MGNTVKSDDIGYLASRGWVTLSGFARLVGISYNTAKKLKLANQVEVIDVGGMQRVYVDEVRRFLQEGNRKTSQ